MRTGFVLDDAHWLVVQQGLPAGVVDTQWVSSDAREASEFVAVGGLDLVVAEASDTLLTQELVQVADQQGIMLAALITRPGAEQWADQRGVGHRLYQPEDLVALVTGQSPTPESGANGSPLPPDALPPDALSPNALAEASGPSRLGTLRVFWGPHGAPGVSTLCVSTASVLARQGLRVCVVDADARGGVISTALGVLDPIPGFLAAIRLAGKGELNQRHVERLVSRYLSPPTEFAILTGAPRALLPGEVPRDSLDALLALLRELFDVVLVDTGSDVPLRGEDRPSAGAEITAHLLQRADDIVAVCGVSPAGVARCARAMPELEAQASGTPVRVWLNGVDTSRRAAGDEAMLREALWRFAGLDDYASLPRDTPLCVDSERRALSPIDVNPQSGFAHALRHELAGFVEALDSGHPDSGHLDSAHPTRPLETKPVGSRVNSGRPMPPVGASDTPRRTAAQGHSAPAPTGFFSSRVARLRRRWLELTALR
ncbi:hypothetical protein [Pontimonas sp.]|uniref:AAA family ATPase n=1 Tax=Pontimonas sp. TaxID=2304492 RepID=UPI00287005EB|nr:hypothetical protein [Pontimonas sp.]MDR9396682.1 hypothetical protein [Pontimonas sp.]